MTHPPTRLLIWSTLLAGIFSPIPNLAQELATISVNVESPGRVIPNDFGGLSIEVDDAANKYLGTASSPNLVFHQLLKNLGQGTIRIGGDSADYSCWNPIGAPRPQDCRFTITEDAINGYLNASATTGWGLILDFNLAQNSPQWVLPYAVAIANTLPNYPGSRVMFEFGNEPNLYSSENISGNPVAEGEASVRPKDYSWRDYVNEWRSHTATLRSNALTKSIPLVGPAYDTSNAWINLNLGSFLDGVGASNLGLVTVHEYPTHHNCVPGQADEVEVTISNMLSQPQLNSYIYKVTANDWVGNAQRRGLDLQLEETGYTACANKPAVNDVYASTLWSVDWLFTNFQLGFRRLNLYIYTDDYSVIHASAVRQAGEQVRYDTLAEPGYYGLYAFSKNASGKAILPIEVNAKANIKSYAVREGKTGSVTVFVLNKDMQARGTVAVEPQTTMGPADIVFVSAPALDSKTVTYGETSFDPKTGKLQKSPRTTTVHAVGGKYKFELPNASIAILTIQPSDAKSN